MFSYICLHEVKMGIDVVQRTFVRIFIIVGIIMNIMMIHIMSGAGMGALVLLLTVKEGCSCL